MHGDAVQMCVIYRIKQELLKLKVPSSLDSYAEIREIIVSSLYSDCLHCLLQ